MHPGLAANDLLHGRHDKLSNETMSPLCRSALNRLNSSMSAPAPLRLADFSDNARCRQTVAVLWYSSGHINRKHKWIVNARYSIPCNFERCSEVRFSYTHNMLQSFHLHGWPSVASNYVATDNLFMYFLIYSLSCSPAELTLPPNSIQWHLSTRGRSGVHPAAIHDPEYIILAFKLDPYS